MNLPTVYSSPTEEAIALINPLAEYIVEATDTYVRFAFPPGVMAHNPPLRRLLSLFNEVAIGWDSNKGPLLPGDAAIYTLYYKSLPSNY